MTAPLTRTERTGLIVLAICALGAVVLLSLWGAGVL